MSRPVASANYDLPDEALDAALALHDAVVSVEGRIPCRYGPDRWFAPNATVRAEAAAICRDRCPIRDVCLAAAVAADEQHGCWGGHDFGDRATREHLLGTTTRRMDVTP